MVHGHHEEDLQVDGHIYAAILTRFRWELELGPTTTRTRNDVDKSRCSTARRGSEEIWKGSHRARQGGNEISPLK